MLLPKMRFILLLGGLSWFSLPTAFAETPENASAPILNTPADVESLVFDDNSEILQYRPPRLTAPSRRVGGGTRGPNGQSVPLLAALVPDHTGYTMYEQPTLYWYISEKTSKPIELVIINADPGAFSDQPAFTLPLKVTESGYQSVNLLEQGIKLELGVEYEWFISLIINPTRRSQDVITSGLIQRVGPDANILQLLERSPPERLPAVYAASGLWYDAFASLSKQLLEADNSERKNKLETARQSLLKQVGLEQILEGDSAAKNSAQGA